MPDLEAKYATLSTEKEIAAAELETENSSFKAKTQTMQEELSQTQTERNWFGGTDGSDY